MNLGEAGWLWAMGYGLKKPQDARRKLQAVFMMNMHFRRLLVWQKSMRLAKDIYRLSVLLPRNEQYGLSSQMRRAAVSVPSNIAEGSQRTSEKEFAHFLMIAKGSLAELQTQVLLAEELNFWQPKDLVIIHSSITEVDRMLYAFHAKLMS